MKTLFALILVLAVPLQARQSPLAGADDRPFVEDMRSADLGSDFLQKYEAGEYPLLKAKLLFLAEIVAFYEDDEFYFLARDCDSLYDLLRILFIDNPQMLKRIHLINISRDIAKDPNVSKFLDQTGIYEESGRDALILDQGFEGSIPAMIWSKQKGSRVIRSFFISSVHPDIPSSRVASRPYAPKFDGDHDAASGHLVDDLEAVPHYLPKSADHLEWRGTKWVPVSSFTLDDLRTNATTQAALQYMRVVKAFGWLPEVRMEFYSMLNTLTALKRYLISDEPLQVERSRALVKAAREIGGIEVLQDMREMYWKGHLKVPAARFQEFWLQTLGAPPDVVDMYDDVIADAHKLQPKSAHWLSKNWSESGAAAVKAGAVAFALSLRLPPLWDAVLEACVKAGAQKECLAALQTSPHREEMARDKVARPGEVQKVTAPSGLTYEALREQIRTANKKTLQLGERWRVGYQRELGKKIGEGTHCDVYQLGRDRAIKLPYEAEDAAYLKAELEVYADLKARLPELGLLEIIESDPQGFFLVKPLVSKEAHATHILKRGLSHDQLRSLETLFEASRKYARATGIGLDLKADNLVWIGDQWKLLEAGPRIRHVPFGYTLEPADFEAYLKIWALEDLPGPAVLLPENVTREPLTAMAPVTAPAPVVATVPTRIEPKIETVDAWWASAPSYVSPRKKVESLVEIEEMPKAELIHHFDYFEIAEREGRVFHNPQKGALGNGVYTYVVFSDGSWVFGQDANGLEIGSKHFQIAQGRAVVAAGEYHAGRFSLQSGGFSRDLLKIAGYSEMKTAERVRQLFLDRLGLDLEYSEQTLFDKPEAVSISLLKPYCANETFRHLHRKTICAGWPENACAARLEEEGRQRE